MYMWYIFLFFVTQIILALYMIYIYNFVIMYIYILYLTIQPRVPLNICIKNVIIGSRSYNRSYG